MATRTPPRYVPTLTEVVRPTSAQAPVAGLPITQEQLVRRVMQQVDMTLERKLREAVAATVLEHTRAIAPLLREEIEAVVRETVTQAFAHELDSVRTESK